MDMWERSVQRIFFLFVFELVFLLEARVMSFFRVKSFRQIWIRELVELRIYLDFCKSLKYYRNVGRLQGPRPSGTMFWLIASLFLLSPFSSQRRYGRLELCNLTSFISYKKFYTQKRLVFTFLIIKTSLINYAVASGNGNKEFYRETASSD